MTTFKYRCCECGTVVRNELAAEERWSGDEYPPETVVAICGERDDGCGGVYMMDYAGPVE